MSDVSLNAASLSAAANKAGVNRALRLAASETGVDFDYLFRTAQRESSLNPEAKARTSSATGLFQFTDATWLSVVDRYGEKYGIGTSDSGQSLPKDEVLALRNDPVASARLAAELANENAALLENRIGREPTSQELYSAHFLGPAGAARLIEAVRDNPRANASELFPAAARANPAIFNSKDGEPRSVSAVYSRLTGHRLSDVDGVEVASSDTVSRPTGYAPVFEEASSYRTAYSAPSVTGAPVSALSGVKLTSGLLLTLLDLQERHLSQGSEAEK